MSSADFVTDALTVKLSHAYMREVQEYIRKFRLWSKFDIVSFSVDLKERSRSPKYNHHLRFNCVC